MVAGPKSVKVTKIGEAPAPPEQRYMYRVACAGKTATMIWVEGFAEAADSHVRLGYSSHRKRLIDGH